MLKLTIVIVLGALVLIALALRVADARWHDATLRLRHRLESARRPARGARFQRAMLEDLPAPVARYLDQVLADGQPMVTAATVRHEGTFNMATEGERWVPFTSEQRVVMDRPGFVWDARIRMAPGVRAYVHDAYVEGEGILEGKALAMATVVSQRGTSGLARGELMRFLAEAAWYPTRLLPGRGLAWHPVDGSSARAELRDGPVTAVVTFHFGEDGLIEAISAPDRERDVDGSAVPTPWRGRFWGYAERSGMHVPLEGEVGWVIDGAYRPYWRGEILALRHDWSEDDDGAEERRHAPS